MAVIFPRIYGAVDTTATADVGDPDVSAIVATGTQFTLSVEPSISTVADTALAPFNVA